MVAFEDGFETFVKRATGQHDFALAFLAYEANIGANPDYFPISAATWMFFAQAHDVA
jgi:hypothetical protein